MSAVQKTAIEDEIAAGGRVRDLVCSRAVDIHDEARLHRATWAGRAFFFCSATCARRFKDDPERYLPVTAAVAWGLTRIDGTRLIGLPLLPSGGTPAIVGVIDAQWGRQIEQKVRGVPGVERAGVEAGGRNIHVLFRPEMADPAAILDVLKEAGLAPPVRVVRWLVEGVYCASCLPVVERELEKLPGAIVAVMDQVGTELTLLYQPGWVTREDVSNALERAGCRAIRAGG